MHLTNIPKIVINYKACPPPPPKKKKKNEKCPTITIFVGAQCHTDSLTCLGGSTVDTVRRSVYSSQLRCSVGTCHNLLFENRGIMYADNTFSSHHIPHIKMRQLFLLQIPKMRRSWAIITSLIYCQYMTMPSL